MSNANFTHFDNNGNAIMVDVSDKEISLRTARASGFISLNPHALEAIKSGTVKKGDVLGIARIAGISAAKRTADIIPLCHPLIYDFCKIDFNIDDINLQIETICTVKLSGKTGAEMEALLGVSAALLTIYDMCKSIDREMIISNIHLLEKTRA